jgi:hypothetical protein
MVAFVLLIISCGLWLGLGRNLMPLNQRQLKWCDAHHHRIEKGAA